MRRTGGSRFLGDSKAREAGQPCLLGYVIIQAEFSCLTGVEVSWRIRTQFEPPLDSDFLTWWYQPLFLLCRIDFVYFVSIHRVELAWLSRRMYTPGSVRPKTSAPSASAHRMEDRLPVAHLRYWVAYPPFGGRLSGRPVCAAPPRVGNIDDDFSRRSILRFRVVEKSTSRGDFGGKSNILRLQTSEKP